MHVYVELGPRVSEGSDASRKYVLDSGRSPEFSGVPESPYICFSSSELFSNTSQLIICLLVFTCSQSLLSSFSLLSHMQGLFQSLTTPAPCGVQLVPLTVFMPSNVSINVKEGHISRLACMHCFVYHHHGSQALKALKALG